MKEYPRHQSPEVERAFKEICGYDVMPNTLSSCDAMRLALFVVDELQRVKAELVEVNGKTKVELLEANERIKAELLEANTKVRSEPVKTNEKTRTELLKENERLRRELAEAKIAVGRPWNWFLGLRAAVRDGSARQRFPVGTVLPDHWTDIKTNETFDMPWRIVDYRDIRATPDGELRPAAILLRVNTVAREIAFDLNERCIYDGSSICTYMATDYEQGCSAGIREAASSIWLPEEGVVANFFLPSPEELHSDVRGASRLEELTWEYFCDAPTHRGCEKRTFCDVLTGHRARNVWLRSRYAAFSVCGVRTDGYVSTAGPFNAYSVLAACAIA